MGFTIIFFDFNKLVVVVDCIYYYWMWPLCCCSGQHCLLAKRHHNWYTVLLRDHRHLCHHFSVPHLIT